MIVRQQNTYSAVSNKYATVAQLDRATGFYPVCRGFESLQSHQQTHQSTMSTDYTKSQKQLAIEATERAMADFLARGGVIQQVSAGKSGIPEGGYASAWGRPKKRSVMPETPIDQLPIVESEPLAEPENIDALDIVDELGDEPVFSFDDPEDDVDHAE